MLALAKIAAAAGGGYASHIRSEDRDFWDAIDEVIAIGRQHRMPVHVSHLKLGMHDLWGQAAKLIGVLDRARSEGVQLTADIYPYTYWQSNLGVLYPKRNFADAGETAFVLAHVALADDIVFNSFRAHPDYAGKTLAQVAALRGTSAARTLMDLLAEPGGASAGIVAKGMSDGDVERLVGTARAQPPSVDFVHDRDYRFDRMEATRAVNDEQDRGTIRLVTFVYRPLKTDRREVVVFSIGSTGGMIRSPKEPGDGPSPALIRFFVSRGYTLVVPQRRGRGESTGTYVEECSTAAGTCTPAEQLALTDRGLREAMLDTNAVIDQLVYGRLAPRDAKILLAGQSRGGFLSLMLAGERPSQVKAVINFAGGWQSLQPALSEAQFKERIELHVPRLVKAAKQFTGPSIWIYAARDPMNREGAPRLLLDAWQGAGGRAEYLFIAEHALPNPHLAINDASLWGRQLDAFLSALDKSPAPAVR